MQIKLSINDPNDGGTVRKGFFLPLKKVCMKNCNVVFGPLFVIVNIVVSY